MYFINECKTSSLCPDREEELEKFKIVDNLRAIQTKGQAKNEIQRVIEAVYNLRKALLNLSEIDERSSYFRQDQSPPQGHVTSENIANIHKQTTKILR